MPEQPLKPCLDCGNWPCETHFPKPSPCECGSIQITESYTEGVGGNWTHPVKMICEECGKEGPPGDTEIEALFAWNTRKGEDDG